MRLFGLIGYPLGHSFSGTYFAAKFEKEQLAECRYELFPISDIAQLPEILSDHPQLEGLNVTIPYKEQVLPYLHSLDPKVKEIGACNCIRVKAGRLHGCNTDVEGFHWMLVPYLQPWHKEALVLGTGGAAKAVAWVLRNLGISYTLVSRSVSGMHIAYKDLSAELVQSRTLIINTTPLGMQPWIGEAPPIPYDAIGGRHLLVDLIYNPDKTEFLLRGERQGAATLNGRAMLEIQAEASWRIWNSSD